MIRLPRIVKSMVTDNGAFRTVPTMLYRVVMLGVLCYVLFGCSSIVIEPENEWDHALLLPGPIEDTQPYQVYAVQDASISSEINYLVNMTRFSPFKFWRNGQMFTGDQAAQWLEYKINRFSAECETTESFIDNVASFSRNTGKEYYLVMENSHMCPFRIVLYNELNRLRAHEKEKAEQLLKEQLLEKKKQEEAAAAVAEAEAKRQAEIAAMNATASTNQVSGSESTAAAADPDLLSNRDQGAAPVQSDNAATGTAVAE